jgi:hypothetical protein
MIKYLTGGLALALAGSVAVSCARGIVHDRELAQERQAFSEYRETTEREGREASEAARKREKEMRDAADQAQAQANALRLQMDADVRAARVASQRVRDAAATAALVAGSQCAGATVTAVSKAGAVASRVLADVLGIEVASPDSSAKPSMTRP